MTDFITMQQIDAAATFVKSRINVILKLLILGSGLGDLADTVEK